MSVQQNKVVYTAVDYKCDLFCVYSAIKALWNLAVQLGKYALKLAI